jgi:hypothetical protein
MYRQFSRDGVLGQSPQVTGLSLSLACYISSLAIFFTLVNKKP